MSHLYVHIPFCKSRCIYCDFYSTTLEEKLPEYVEALCHEIAARSEETIYVNGTATAASRSPVRTIYIGGGTPSLLTDEQLTTIMDCMRTHYDVCEDAEVTVEMNPEDVVRMTNEELRMKNEEFHSSFNRVSLGVQTFDDGLLKLLRRRHDAQRAVEAVHTLQEAGIENISIDLIYGLPQQTMEMWQRDLDTAFALGVQHLSAYALSYEEGTPLTRLREAGTISEAPDELSVRMYEHLCDRAAAAGFEHYEISNFARPEYHSRHNSAYWTTEPYLGFGPGAHSYDGNRTRRANSADLKDYIDTMRNGRAETMKVSTEQLSDDELYDEAVMCGLRTAQGIDLNAIRQRFGNEKHDYLLSTAKQHLATGLLRHTPEGHISLTRRALMVSDDVMSDLMW